MTVIGHGAFVLKSANNTPVNRVIRYIIKDNDIEFYDPASSQSSAEIVALLAAFAGPELSNRGHISLNALPASPEAAFYTVALSATTNDFRLTLEYPQAFAWRGQTFFDSLNLTFTKPKAGKGLTVEGRVILHLFGHSDLAIELDIGGSPQGLLFTPKQEVLAIEGLGRLKIDALKLESHETLWNDLEALYTFSEFGEASENAFGDGAGIFQQPAGSQQSAQLIIKGKADNIQATTGGISLNSGSDTGQIAYLESPQAGKTIADKCKSKQAITISAWIKPTKELTDQKNTPKRIISLSENNNERNFTLGQDIDGKEYEKGKRYNRYVVRLRRGNGHDNGTPPLVSTSTALKINKLAHVVFIRGDENSPSKSGKIYVNGKDETFLEAQKPGTLDPNSFSTDLSGSFDRWENNHSFLLGNEKGGELKKDEDRSWKGEIHQVAIYSRALSEQEILHSYVPSISLQATLSLDRVPVPFNLALPVTIDFDANQLNVNQPETVLQVTPSLKFTQVHFNWDAQESNLKLLSGQVVATLWDTPIDLGLSLTEDEFRLSKPDTAETTLTLNDIAPLSPLGEIKLKQLVLRADRTADLAWIFETDGQITFGVIPPPLKGPFPVELFLDQENLWLSIAPKDSLTLVNRLSFNNANLRFLRNDSGWQVEPDLRQEPGGISLALFGETRILTPQLISEDRARALKLAWTEEPVNKQLGKLNLSRFSLTSEPDSSETFWYLVIKGEIPLGVTKPGRQPNILDFDTLTLDTSGGKIIGNPGNFEEARYLQGNSSLSSQTAAIFTGSLRLEDTRFQLTGPLNLFSPWSTVQVGAAVELSITTRDGQISLNRVPAQVNLPESTLVNPEIELANKRLRLSGYWLGQPEAQSFYIRERQSGIFLEGVSELSMPFSLALPTLIDDKTGATLAQAVQIAGELITIKLDTEFNSSGFMGLVNATFNYSDAAQVDQTITLPERRLYTPPVNLSRLLGDSLAQITETAPELFREQGRHSRDYFVTLEAEQPQIFLSGTGSLEAQMNCVMPALFELDQDFSSADGQFTLKQTGDTCELIFTLEAGQLSKLRDNYDDLLTQVAAKTLRSAGAANLLKRRIAERLPLNYSDLLYYYYGWDVDAGYIDLQAGMRLRIDLQNYQFVQASDPTAQRGFVGSGSFYVPVNSYTYPQNGGNVQLLGFGPFLSRLQVNGALDIANQGAGSVFDLLKDGYRKAYYRLFFPKQPSVGASSERAVTLIGADTLQEMQAATEAFDNHGGGSASTGTSFFFRGRAVVLPEIQIYAGDQPIYVPVGTTLRQLLEMYDDIPPADLPGQDLRQFAGSARPLRLVHDGVNSEPTYRFINFANSGSVGNMDVLDLPLVKGDRIGL